MLSALGSKPLLASVVNPELYYFEDSTGKLLIGDIQKLDAEGKLANLKASGKAGYGFSKSAFWVRFDYRHDMPSPIVYLSTSRSDYQTMEVFVYDHQGSLIIHTDQGVAAAHKQLQTRLPAGRMELVPGNSYRFYVRIISSMQMSFSLFMASEKAYFKVLSNETAFYFAYYGTVIGLSIYNLCLFLIIRSKDYLFYVFFGTAMLLNAYVQGGFGEYANLSIPFLESTADSYRIILFPSLTSLLFTYSFLQLHKRSRLLTRAIYTVLGTGTFVQILLWAEPDSFVRHIVSIFDVCAVLAVFVGSGMAIRAGDRIAKIFLLAWGILATSVAIWVLGNAGILPKNFLVAMAPLAGNMTEMLLMSMALAMRIHDIKERKLVAEVKAEEKEKLQKLLRMVIHDISNPLSIVKSGVFVAKRSLGENEHIARIERASASIEAILAQVRKFQAVSSGKIPVDLKPCSVRSAIDDIAFTFQNRAEEKGIELLCELPPEGDDIWLVGDANILSHEILNNIISNALKFTHRGGRIHLSAMVKGNHVLIMIKDTGIGMPQDMILQIFDPAQPTSRVGTDAERGTGFGMPLVKSFVELFEGEIFVESIAKPGPDEKNHDRIDHGTTITLKFKKAFR